MAKEVGKDLANNVMATWSNTRHGRLKTLFGFYIVREIG